MNGQDFLGILDSDSDTDSGKVMTLDAGKMNHEESMCLNEWPDTYIQFIEFLIKNLK